jgi:hypothetical protein
MSHPYHCAAVNSAQYPKNGRTDWTVLSCGTGIQKGSKSDTPPAPEVRDPSALDTRRSAWASRRRLRISAIASRFGGGHFVISAGTINQIAQPYELVIGANWFWHNRIFSP